jgi:hypothetical protein
MGDIFCELPNVSCRSGYVYASQSHRPGKMLFVVALGQHVGCISEASYTEFALFSRSSGARRNE